MAPDAVPAAVAVGAPAAGVAPEALRMMVATVLSPAPAFLRAMSALAEVSYLPGEELMVATRRSSERPALRSFRTESLVIISCAKRMGHRRRTRQRRAALRMNHTSRENDASSWRTKK